MVGAEHPESNGYSATFPPIVEQRGPFVVTGREVRHDAYYMQLLADRVVRPDGTPGDQYWVNFTRPAVLVFALDGERNLYMTREFAYASNKYSLGVPGGSVEQGQTLEQAARRESLTELGLELNSLHDLGRVRATTNRVNDVSYLFYATVSGIREQQLEPGEVISLQRVPFEEAYQWAMDGWIETVTVAYGIIRVKNYLDSLR